MKKQTDTGIYVPDIRTRPAYRVPVPMMMFEHYNITSTSILFSWYLTRGHEQATNSVSMEENKQRSAVSYTHLTLPTKA